MLHKYKYNEFSQSVIIFQNLSCLLSIIFSFFLLIHYLNGILFNIKTKLKYMSCILKSFPHKFILISNWSIYVIYWPNVKRWLREVVSITWFAHINTTSGVEKRSLPWPMQKNAVLLLTSNKNCFVKPIVYVQTI